MSFVTGVVVAAGSSSRLGRPKQLLRVGDATLLDATLATARRCGFDQLIVTLGAASDEIRAVVDLAGCDVVEADRHRDGCSASIGAAVAAVDPRAAGLVLLLGDQPGIDPASVEAIIDRASPNSRSGVVIGRSGDRLPPQNDVVDRTPIAVGRYSDGIGHPFWFARSTFGALAAMHGDKAVWKLIESGEFDVTDVALPGRVPLDVDTWEDYQRLVGSRE